MLTVLSICMRFRCHPGLGLALKYYLPRYASCEVGGPQIGEIYLYVIDTVLPVPSICLTYHRESEIDAAHGHVGGGALRSLVGLGRS
jgi:hypothetical protein